jgi:hypothetical protein
LDVVRKRAFILGSEIIYWRKNLRNIDAKDKELKEK